MNGGHEADSSYRQRMREAVLLLLVGLTACLSGVSFLLGRLATWFVMSFAYVSRSAGLR